MAFTSKSVAHCLLASATTLKLAGILARKALASYGFSSRLMPTICKPLSLSCSCISFRNGKDWAQGPHQEAQKSTYKTWPLYRCKSSVWVEPIGDTLQAGIGLPASTAKTIEFTHKTARARAVFKNFWYFKLRINIFPSVNGWLFRLRNMHEIT